MAIQIQLRRGTSSTWTTSNPTLAQGEMGLEYDSSRFKIGDGVTAWNSLTYASGAIHFVDFSEVDDVTVGNPKDGDFLQYNTATTQWIATTTVKTLQVLSPVPSTSPTTGGLVVTGGIGVTGDINVAGSIYFSGTATLALSEGKFYGDEYGFSSLYAGIQNFTTLTETVIQITANTSTFAQVNFQNINSGTEASGDIVVTNDTGNQETGYINLGINSSNYSNPNYSASQANDGYLYVAGANLVMGTDSTGTAVKIHVGGTLAENVAVSVNEANTSATSTTTGALTVQGGVGITGDLYVGGKIYGTVANMKLSDLSDVSAATPDDGALLVYQSFINKWIASTNLTQQNMDAGEF